MAHEKIIEKFNLEGKEIIFRYPKLKDLEGLLDIINSLVEEKAMLTVQKKKTKREEKKWFLNKLKKIGSKKAISLVVQIEEKAMGSVFIEKGERISEDHAGKLGISLRKEIRGKGIGKKLLNEAIKEAKKILKIKIVRLRTMGNNKIAQNFYKKSGFKEIGRIKNGFTYYGKYVDEVIMVKYI
ncbi:GNAT family N-acetyltransferase [Patescibacteria group bacterium]|nr:GNAT family N-acetyltransferase [Patescibacteria group bacterium]